MADRCCCPIELEVMESPPLEWGLSEYIPMEGSDLPEYEGPYEVVPSRHEQTLATSYKAMTADVVVAPIPSNYGLVTWNGSILTVS